jgi:undecaprenyl diphosphate synthase
MALHEATTPVLRPQPIQSVLEIQVKPLAVGNRSSGPGVRYLAIVADGNGRWARARGLPVSAGHEAGADTLKARVSDAAELGVEQLTVYSFSTENWARPAEEVHGLISMLARRIARETPDLDHQEVRMRFIGRRHGLTTELLEQMRWAEQLTAKNHRLTLFIALNYGGRAEMLDAAKRFNGTTEQEFRECLYDPQLHDPELVIRTGGEQRLSNYLMWQAANSQLAFREELWPDFTREALAQTLADCHEHSQHSMTCRDPARDRQISATRPEQDIILSRTIRTVDTNRQALPK